MKLDTLIHNHGPCANVEISRDQDIALFGFFSSGLSVIECFSFALYSLGSFSHQGEFPLDNKSLKRVAPNSVAKSYQKIHPDFVITQVLNEIIQDDKYQKWKRIRNVLTHRTVPRRLSENW